MAYSSENSCKKGCSCDSCKGSHKSIKSEGILKTVKDLAKKAKDTATVEIGKALPDVDPDMSGPLPGIGVVVNPLAAKVARNSTVRNVANKVAGAISSAAEKAAKVAPSVVGEASDPYYGTAQHLQDLKDTKQEHLRNAEQAAEDKNYVGAQRHRQMAHEVDQRIKQHPLYKIEEGFIKKLKSLNKKTKTTIDRYRETQKRLSQKPPSAARAKAMRKAFDVVDSKGKGHMVENSKGKEDMLKESKFAVGDKLQNNTRETMQGVKPGVPHEVVKVESEPGPFGNLVTYHLKNPITGKVFRFRNAHVLLKKLDEELKTVDDVTKTLPRGVEKKGPGEAYGNVDKCAPAPKDKNKTVVAGKTGEEYSKKPQEEVKQMSEDKYTKLAEAAFGSLNRSNPFRSAPLNEISYEKAKKTLVDLNKMGHDKQDPATTRFVRHDLKAPPGAYLDTSGERNVARSFDNIARHIERKHGRAAAAAAAHAAIGGPFKSSDSYGSAWVSDKFKALAAEHKPEKMDEEVEHLDEVSYQTAKNTLGSLNRMIHDKQDPATTRFVRHDLKAPPGAYLDTSGERNVARSFDNIARHIENKFGRKAAAEAAHNAIHGEHSYGSAWVSDKFKALAAEHKPEADQGFKPREESINNRNYYVEKDIAEIMKETYKKKMKMQEAMDIHIASPEQREDWLSVGRGAMDVLDYINKYKV